MEVTVHFTYFDVAKEESFSTERALEAFLDSAEDDVHTEIRHVEMAGRKWDERC